MASEPDIQPIISDPEQQLRDENEALKAELAQMRRSMDLQKYRRHEVSKMLKVGFWEWDEIHQQPISFSPEMADVLGIDQAQVEAIFHDSEPTRIQRHRHHHRLRCAEQQLHWQSYS